MHQFLGLLPGTSNPQSLQALSIVPLSNSQRQLRGHSVTASASATGERCVLLLLCWQVEVAAIQPCRADVRTPAPNNIRKTCHACYRSLRYSPNRELLRSLLQQVWSISLQCAAACVTLQLSSKHAGSGADTLQLLSVRAVHDCLLYISALC